MQLKKTAHDQALYFCQFCTLGVSYLLAEVLRQSGRFSLVVQLYGTMIKPMVLTLEQDPQALDSLKAFSIEGSTR